jgi:2-hydroxychromene-2-carboxylate isomerase
MALSEQDTARHGADPMEFWFEFGSTYSYVAASRVDDVAGEAGSVVRWKPFLLGPIFRRQGWQDSPFNLFEARGRYMWRDIQRLCAKYGMPFRRPSRFPRNGLLAARVACLHEEAAWMPEFARAVYRANFAEDREISDPDLIRGLLEGMNLDGEGILLEAVKAENKDRLRRQTEKAWSLGIFGAPTFVAGGEIFWGNDRLEDALEWTWKK